MGVDVAVELGAGFWGEGGDREGFGGGGEGGVVGFSDELAGAVDESPGEGVLGSGGGG